MLREFLALTRQGALLLCWMTVLTGIAYPLLVLAVGQALFPHQANGSLIRLDGRVTGSSLIGQQFDDPRYFRGRPSATAPGPYNAAASAGSNLGPSNPALHAAVEQRTQELRTRFGAAAAPEELVTASASGLDPHLSPAAVLLQAGTVARARGLDTAAVEALVARHVQPIWLGLWGGERVNVLELNLALDRRE